MLCSLEFGKLLKFSNFLLSLLLPTPISSLENSWRLSQNRWKHSPFQTEAPQLGWNAHLVIIEPAFRPVTLKIAPRLTKQKTAVRPAQSRLQGVSGCLLWGALLLQLEDSGRARVSDGSPLRNFVSALLVK